jgi:uncharacterized membrane protein
MQRTNILKIITIVAVLTLLALGGTYLWGGFEGMSGHGVGALIAGIIISLALGVGLMMMMYSSNREHDEAAHHAAKENFPKKNE